MKIFKLLTIALLFTIVGCKCNQGTTENKPAPDNNQALIIKMPDQVNIGQHIKIEAITNLKEGIILYDPALLRIERHENKEWKSVRILHCPCGAYCMPPLKKGLITIEKNWSKSWNLIESWCVDSENNNIPETIEQAVTPGKYRVVFYYGITEKERIKFTNEFEIIN